MKIADGLSKKRISILLGILLIAIILFVVNQKTNLIYYLLTAPLGPEEQKQIKNSAQVRWEDETGAAYGPETAEVTINILEDKIQVKVKLDGRELDNFASPIEITALESGTENMVGKFSGNTDATGQAEITVDLPDGVYDFRVKIPSYLTTKIEAVAWPAVGPAEFGTVLAGDLNNDNIIEVLDWGEMRKKWDTDDEIADINQDGIVDTLDWGLMRKNWEKEGN